MIRRNIVLLGFVFVLSGCALGPDFLRPFNAASDGERTFLNDVYSVDGGDTQDISLWWERIDDPIFNEYVSRLLRQNLQLKQAAERIVQAQARANISRGGFFPSIGTATSGSRSFTNNFGNFSSVNSDRTFTESFDASLEVSWALDLFGRVRRSVEAADANILASEYDRKALVHALIAQLLNTRVEVASQKKFLELAQKTADNQRDILKIIERRYEMGTANTRPQDILNAQDNVARAEADVALNKRLLADAAYRLDVLLGQTPGTFDPFEADFAMIAPPVDVPICLPADLLDRRPDLRASELRVKAANADIGLAIADLYPQFSLGGSIGFGSPETSNLFNANQLAGNILASITSRLFEGGALRANINLQRAETRELAALYAENVLNAMREVESSLQAEKALHRQLQMANQSAEALRKAEKITYGRYLRGIENLNDFLLAQQEHYLAQQTVISVQTIKWNTRTALYLALGGDWFGHVPNDGCGYASHKQANNKALDTDTQGQEHGENKE
ncbi:MAG: efflux transporter outer membrane subunit [Bdellovibrionales bacterium]